MKINEWINSNFTQEEKIPKIIGITGTVGKTTTIELLYNYLVRNNNRVYCVSTSGISCNFYQYKNIKDFQGTSFYTKASLALNLKSILEFNCD